ncbi:MAG: hypothetical protein IJ272_09485 [Clostridia bacterium]|nr:hypothetical protein [Clostridia bacterium]
MGKGGALSIWIKEFCSLVFTQTLQAFIYAIIIIIILFGMVNDTGDISADDNNAALGLMSTFALLSVFKVEEMAKRIFGLGDTKATPGNAMKSIAKTAIAAKVGKRVLDNTGKVLGGIKAINKAGQDNRKTKARLEEDMADNGFAMVNGKATYVGKSKSSTTSAGSTGGTSIGGGAIGGASADVGSVDAGPASVGVTSSGTSGDVDVISDAAKRRMKNALRNYEDKMDEIKKARNEGWKTLISGTVETPTAIFGAATGAVLGGADGNLDEMLQGAMAGAGVGDALAQSTIDALDRTVQFAQRNYKRQKGLQTRELKKTIDSYKKAVEDINVKYGVTDVSDI